MLIITCEHCGTKLACVFADSKTSIDCKQCLRLLKVQVCRNKSAPLDEVPYGLCASCKANQDRYTEILIEESFDENR
jgi:hypothetical protein